ncbi:MAG: membrane protein [Saprospiraceae bacterium]|nr:MAG: membrane protein [Saprospiraceae bacterium]
MKIHANFALGLALMASVLLITGCNASKAAKGGVIGGAAGGVIGGVIGKKSGNTAVGAIIGAAIGGTAGALIGRYMDKQAKEIEQDLEGAEVERVGEGILVTFDSGLMFGFDSYALTSTTKANLQELAATLKKYEDTDILIEGHTDSKGTEEYNLTLSRKRAQTVSDYLTQQGVRVTRLNTVGYGESQPLETNDTEAGRQSNRRVEVAIYANEDLKKDAESGKLKN